MTGLANRRAFYAASAGLRGGAVALAIADVDRFKRINDQHGHAAGDMALIAVAHVMRDELSDLGLVARLGGEEFGWLCGEAAPALVREPFAAPAPKGGRSAISDRGALGGAHGVGGLCRARRRGNGRLYSAADRALYAAKSAGRDRVVAFDEIDPTLAAELREAS